MNKKKHKISPEENDKPKNRFLWKALLLSLLLHGLFSLYLVFEAKNLNHNSSTNSTPIKVNIVHTAVKPKNEQPDKKILETPLVPTAAPEEFEHLGQEDHIAKKETKLKKIPLIQQKALSAAQTPQIHKIPSTPKNNPSKDKSTSQKLPSTLFSNDESMSLHAKSRPLTNTDPRNDYENFFNKSIQHLEYAGGHLEMLDGDQADGDAIDLNTKEFRYISYFTGLRKAIELVWNYPLEAAQKGIQGKVHIKFTIQANGRVSQVQIAQSSGHEILDLAIVNAIKLAAPFAPLPKGFLKKQLTITGSFTYILTSYATSY